MLSEIAQQSSSDLLHEFDTQYSQSPFLSTPATSQCHTASLATASLPSLAVQEQAQQAQGAAPAESLHLAALLLRSWDHPLFHLVSEAHLLPALRLLLRSEGRWVALLSHRLQRVLRSIAHQCYPEVPGMMDYAAWTELPSLQSADEETHLPVFYNLLHCWSMDAKKIHTYLKAVECQVISDGNF